MGVVYTCTRLVVNVSQSYFPVYLTETLNFQKVCWLYCRLECKHLSCTDNTYQLHISGNELKYTKAELKLPAQK